MRRILNTVSGVRRDCMFAWFALQLCLFRVCLVELRSALLVSSALYHSQAGLSGFLLTFSCTTQIYFYLVDNKAMSIWKYCKLTTRDSLANLPLRRRESETIPLHRHSLRSACVCRLRVSFGLQTIAGWFETLETAQPNPRNSAAPQSAAAMVDHRTENRANHPVTSICICRRPSIRTIT